MVDTLVAFGCSNTYGNEALEAGKTSPDNIYHAYPYHLCQKLNIPNYRNYSVSGSSNVAIGMKVVDFILNNQHLHKNIFVVIGWSGDNRLTIVKPGGSESSIRSRDKSTASVISGNMNTKTTDQVFDCLGKLQDKVFFNNGFTKKLLFSHYIEKHGVYEKNFLQNLLRDLLTIFVFNTEPFIFLNAIVRYGVTQLLHSYNIQYITIPTILHFPHSIYKLLSKSNNIMCYSDNEDLIFEPEKLFLANKHYGACHTSSTGHMKIAEFLYSFMCEAGTLPNS